MKRERRTRKGAGIGTVTPILMLTVTLLFLAYNGASSYVHVKGRTGGVSPSRIVIKYHDYNSVRLAISNSGQIGNDIISGNGAGFFPGNTPNNYVFGTGIWIGGIADIDGDGHDDELFLQAYDPLSGGTEYEEGRYGQETSDPLASVFRSNDSSDLADWPQEFKVIDEDPESPTYGQLIPLVMSDQDIVTIYNSVEATPIFPTPSPPFEIRQRSLAYTAGLSRQVVIFIFEIENVSNLVPGIEPFTLEDAWMGFDSDMDIGDEFGDDRTSFFQYQVTPQSDSIPIMMGFAWDEDFDETNYVGSDPGFVGVAYLQSPGNYQDNIDNDLDGMIDESPFNGIDDDGDGVIDDQPDEVDQLGLVNYTFHNNPSTGTLRDDPQTDLEGYRIMSCDPPEECVETTIATDVRFMISSGPFSIRPGETHRIVLAFVFANAVGNPTSINVYGDPPRPDPDDPVFGEFLAVKQTVQGIYDLQFLRAGPPLRTNPAFIPGDGQVTILWDNTPVNFPDPSYNEFVMLDSLYRKYDFEGFRLWRSRTGSFSTKGDPNDPLNPIATAENEANDDLDLSLLGQWDLNNGIQTLTHGILITDSLRDNTGHLVIISADTFDLGTDTGLRFSYVDHGEPGAPLLNGFKYYYSIESYDYNSPALPVSAVSLASGISFPPENSVIPYRKTDDLEVTSELSHVDSDGNVLDDDTPGVITMEEYKATPPAATDAMTSYSITTLVDSEVDDTFNVIVLDDVVPNADGASATAIFHIDNSSGEKLYIGGETAELFTMNYDSTTSNFVATVFNPADSTMPLYELSMDLLGYSGFFESPQVEDLTAEDASGNDITESLGSLQMSAGQFVPLGFRGTDIQITWHAVGTDSLTLSVYDTGNKVTVPYSGDELDQAQNWFVDSFGGQPGGQYLIGTPAVFRVYISGSMIAVVGIPRLPEEGDVWTLKQRSYSSAYSDTTISGSDTTITNWVVPEGRPLVPETRYQIEFSPVQDVTSPEFTIGIFQNTILTNDLDIYVVASEELADVPDLTVAGVDVSLGEVESQEVELYSAAYTLDQSGTYSVEVRGTDSWGNEGEGFEEFSVGLILRSMGGVLSSADGVLRLDLPPNAIRDESRYFICRSEGEEVGSLAMESFFDLPQANIRPSARLMARENTISNNLKWRQGSIVERDVSIKGDVTPGKSLESNVALQSGDDIAKKSVRRMSNDLYTDQKSPLGDVILSTDIGKAVSPVYYITPRGEQLDRGAELSFNTRALDLYDADQDGLKIFMWTDEGWLEVDSYFNPASNRVKATVNQLGSYQLRSKGIAGASPFPRVFRLAQNFPNPFNPSTTIGFDIPEKSGEVWTELTIYNIRGHRVRNLLKSVKSPGSYYIHWDGRDDKGQKLASGIYLYRLSAGDFVSIRKLVLVK